MTLSNSDNHISSRQIIIIGGTSGIGLALAQAHLAQNWQVGVVGHSLDKIDDINRLYPTIQTIYCDLTSHAQRQDLFRQLESKSIKDQLQTDSFSRLIYCAGWYLNERVSTLDRPSSDHMLAINLQAFQDTFAWASEQLKQSRQQHLPENMAQPQSAQLITIASVAGLLDYPYSSLYAQSKHAMIATASAYRTALAPYNIDVITIAPGYVDTAMLRALNNGDASHKPFIMSEQQAVKHILKAIEDKTALCVFPTKMKLLIKGLSLLPKSVLSWLMVKKLDKK